MISSPPLASLPVPPKLQRDTHGRPRNVYSVDAPRGVLDPPDHARYGLNKRASDEVSESELTYTNRTVVERKAGQEAGTDINE